jgi:hypothetical protein
MGKRRKKHKPSWPIVDPATVTTPIELLRKPIRFDCQPPEPPAAVAAIADLNSRDIAIEVYRAAWTVCECFKEWSEWIYPETGRKFDEITAADVYRRCAAALFALHASRVFTPILRNLADINSLIELLPNAPAARILAMPDDFRQVVAKSMEEIGPLYSECKGIINQLEVAPLSAIGWGSDLPAEEPSETPGVETTADGTGQAIVKAVIPREHRSKAIGKQKAAQLLGRLNRDSGVKWLNKCIEDGTITCEKLGRTSFIFDKRQFPDSAQAQL